MAAEGEDEPVIAEFLGAAGDGPARRVEVGHLGLHELHADGVQHLRERDDGVRQVGLVVADADRVIRGPVDDQHFDALRPDAEFLQLAGGADGAPKPGEPGAEDDNTLQPPLPRR